MLQSLNFDKLTRALDEAFSAFPTELSELSDQALLMKKQIANLQKKTAKMRLSIARKASRKSR